jgi:hypothetical protein
MMTPNIWAKVWCPFSSLHTTIKTNNGFLPNKMRQRLIIRSLVIRLAVAILPFLVGCSHSGHPSPERQGGPSPLSTKLWAGCSINLKLIDTAKQQWADEKHRSVKDPAPTWDDLGEYIGRGSNNAILPECPCGGTYTIGSLNQTAKCSLSPEEHTHERKEAYEASKTLKRQNSP